MIGACARAGIVLRSPVYVEAAARAAEFLLSRLRDPDDGRLLRRYRDGDARHPAHLEDYAFVTSGFLDLYAATWDNRWLREAVGLTTLMMELFRAEDGRGFHDTAKGDSSVLVRMTEHYDGAEPSGSSVAALNLIRLANMTGRREWREAAEQTIVAAGGVLRQAPHVMPMMAVALSAAHRPHIQVVIAGKRGAEDTCRMLEIAGRSASADVAVLFREGDDDALPGVAPFTRALGAQGGRATAYVCKDFACSLPTTDPDELARLLRVGPRA